MRKILAGILLALLCAHDAVIQAARTFGGVSTDKIALSGYTTNHTDTTWAIWTYRTGNGGGGFGRSFMKDSAGSTDVSVFTTSTNYGMNRVFSTTNGEWQFTRPSASVWHHFAITYNSSSTSNVPIFYIDGASQTVIPVTTPVGTASNNANAYKIGNKANDDGNWAGRLAEFAIWDVILTANEVSALARGVLPLNIRYANLKAYVPVTGVHTTEPDFSSARNAGTVTGTVAATGPPFQSVFLDYGASIPSEASGGSAVPFLFNRRRR